MIRNVAMWILVIGSMGIVLAMGFSVIQSSIDLCDCSLYDEDEDCKLRVSCDNPQIQKLYSDFLGKPGSELAEELLHTSYSPKQKFHIFD